MFRNLMKTNRPTNKCKIENNSLSRILEFGYYDNMPKQIEYSIENEYVNYQKIAVFNRYTTYQLLIILECW